MKLQDKPSMYRCSECGYECCGRVDWCPMCKHDKTLADRIKEVVFNA